MQYCMSHAQHSHPLLAMSHKYIVELAQLVCSMQHPSVLPASDVEEEIGRLFCAEFADRSDILRS